MSSESEPVPCPFCDTQASRRPLDDTPGAEPFPAYYKCDVCGPYVLDDKSPLETRIRRVSERHLMSGWIREKNRSDRRAPSIRSVDECEQVLTTLPRRIPDKAYKLLQELRRRTQNFGCTIRISLQRDYPWAYAKNQDELRALLTYLCDRRSIQFVELSADSDAKAAIAGVMLTADGFAEMETADRRSAESTTAFVAMSYADTHLPIYANAIKPAIREAGWNVYRADFRQFSFDGVAEVKARIRGCRFLVAECTGQRNGVYYAAGFAEGLGREVIWVCHKPDLSKAHFDATVYNHVIWEDYEQLKKSLCNRIVGTIGTGPLNSAT